MGHARKRNHIIFEQSSAFEYQQRVRWLEVQALRDPRAGRHRADRVFHVGPGSLFQKPRIWRNILERLFVRFRYRVQIDPSLLKLKRDVVSKVQTLEPQRLGTVIQL